MGGKPRRTVATAKALLAAPHPISQAQNAVAYARSDKERRDDLAEIQHLYTEIKASDALVEALQVQVQVLEAVLRGDTA